MHGSHTPGCHAFFCDRCEIGAARFAGGCADVSMRSKNARRPPETPGACITDVVAVAQLAMARALARARVHSAAGTCRQAPLVQATKISCTLPSNVRSSICEQRSDGPIP